MMRKWASARLPGRIRNDIINELRQILTNGAISPAQAAEIRGRLGYSQSLLFSLVGRALLHPLSTRQYSKTAARRRFLNGELAVSIKWWINALVEIPPRRTALNHPNPALVYCDAAGPGHISFSTVLNSPRKSGRPQLPCWFVEMAGIYEFELRSAILALRAAALFAPGLPILLRTDNAGAAATLIRGNCSSVLLRVLESVFWTAAASFGSRKSGLSLAWPIRPRATALCWENAFPPPGRILACLRHSLTRFLHARPFCPGSTIALPPTPVLLTHGRVLKLKGPGLRECCYLPPRLCVQPPPHWLLEKVGCEIWMFANGTVDHIR